MTTPHRPGHDPRWAVTFSPSFIPRVTTHANAWRKVVRPCANPAYLKSGNANTDAATDTGEGKGGGVGAGKNMGKTIWRRCSLVHALS